MSKNHTTVAIKNRFNAFGTFEYALRNIRVNGEHRGVSGHIINPANGKIVYINTEGSAYQPLADKVMFRAAESVKDLSGTGGRNQWGQRARDAWIRDAVAVIA